MRYLFPLILIAALSAPAPLDADEMMSEFEPPCGCPLWEIFPMGGGEYLYYCDYFETDCEAVPDGAYYVGSPSTPVPWECCTAHCIEGPKEKVGVENGNRENGQAPPRRRGTSSRRRRARNGNRENGQAPPRPDRQLGERRFPGLERPKPDDYVYEFPAGDARDHGNSLFDETYIKFQDERLRRWVYAKVFLLVMDVGGRRKEKEEKSDVRRRYLAIHIRAEDDAIRRNATVVELTPLDARDSVCYGFHGTYKGLPILALSAWPDAQ